MSPLALSLRFLQAQPDSRLVALARDGHEPAFETLVRRYRKELLSYCRRLQPHSGGAEDALQQTLLQAWRALSAGAEVREVRPWLYRIAHNVTMNNLRVRVAIPHEIADAGGGHEVDELVQQRLQAKAALAGMASLPDVQRQVFISTALDGASHEEVASTLGLSSGAVRGLIYRARATLRAAAAAITPSPVVHWAIKRAETRSIAPGLAEAVAGGGGVGAAAVLAKGGAVLTLAGAVAGAGGVLLGQTSAHHHHHHHHVANLAGSVDAAREASGGLRVGSSGAAVAARAHFAAEDRTSHGAAEHRNPSVFAERRTERAPRQEGRGGSGARSGGGGSRGGSDGVSPSGSSVGSDGGSGTGATVASLGSGSSGGTGDGSGGGTSGGSDGGSSSGSTSTTSGSDGGTSDGGSGATIDQVATVQTTSDGGSGSDGGSSGSGSSSGSGDTTTTTTTTTSGSN